MEKRKEDEQEKVTMKEDEHKEVKVKVNIKSISDYSIFDWTYVIEEFRELKWKGHMATIKCEYILIRFKKKYWWNFWQFRKEY